MYHGIDAVERALHQDAVADVPHEELGVARQVRRRPSRVDLRVESVEDPDGVALGEQAVHHEGPDEPGAAGDQHVHVENLARNQDGSLAAAPAACCELVGAARIGWRFAAGEASLSGRHALSGTLTRFFAAPPQPWKRITWNES